jgi:hypothetical protein
MHYLNSNPALVLTDFFEIFENRIFYLKIPAHDYSHCQRSRRI